MTPSKSKDQREVSLWMSIDGQLVSLTNMEVLTQQDLTVQDMQAMSIKLRSLKKYLDQLIYFGTTGKGSTPQESET